MIAHVMSRISTDSVEALKMAMDSMKMHGQTVMKLIEEKRNNVC